MNVEPLYGLRLRTPRLELRLPTEAELVELFLVAEAGIHPPDEMPFGVAWTDELTLESFLDYHRSTRDTWSTERWRLELGTWTDGRLVGTQGFGAENFAHDRTVGTGSWLGSEFQGGGIGTEMRAAVIELSFGHLDATAVTSSAFEANAASRRVSEKLGYRIVGEETMSPRGVPKPHLLLRLERSDWHGAPFTLDVLGLEPCLPLFGL